jgi:hypothetical protein
VIQQMLLATESGHDTGLPVLTRYSGNPIINYGGGGWKDSQVMTPIVFFDPTDATKLIMVFSSLAAPVNSGQISVGIATANTSDPYTWTECAANPFIIGPGGLNNWADSAVVVGTTVYLYVSHIDWVSNNGLDLYVSTNFTAANAQAGTVTFTKTANVLLASGTETICYLTSVLREDVNHWYMTYVYRTSSVIENAVRTATSPDGVTWTKQMTDILTIGPPGSWNQTYFEPEILMKIGSTYVLPYGGYNAPPYPDTGGHPDARWKFGMATSSSPTSGWSTSSTDPFFAGSEVAGTPDRYHVSTQGWIEVGGIWYMYYCASAGDPATTNFAYTHWSMCVATLSAGKTPLDFYTP